MIMLAIAAASAVPLAQTSYWRCLSAKAHKLERSGELPRDVATATLTLCREERAKFAAERNYGIKYMMTLERALADKIVAQVVIQRADRPSRARRQSDRR